MKGWTILLAVYVIWNACAYTADILFKDDQDLKNTIYWMGERTFVVVTFCALLGLVPGRYGWVFKTLICVAVFKYAYVVLVVTKVIEKNEWASLMGFVFTAVITAMIFRWEKSEKGLSTR